MRIVTLRVTRRPKKTVRSQHNLRHLNGYIISSHRADIGFVYSVANLLRLRVCRRAILFAGVFALYLQSLSGIVMATPIVEDSSVGTAKWKVAVNVYIPLDPKRNDPDPDNRRTRHEQVKQAVEKWKEAAAGTGLTINTTVLDENGHIPGTGQPPDSNTEGSVIVEWADVDIPGHATPLISGEPTGKKTKDGEDILKNQSFISSTIKIDQKITAGKNQDNTKARATMLHETGHALGLDHTKETDSVLQGTIEQYIDKDSPGASDVRELKATYQASNGRLDGLVIPLGAEEFRYAYTATWLSGGEIPLVQVVTLGASIGSPEVPIGWELVGFPFTTFPNIVQFRLAPTDDLQAYLNADNPVETFSFISTGLPGETLGWTGITQTVVGPTIPEPTTLILLASGLAVIGALHRKKFYKKAAVGKRGSE